MFNAPQLGRRGIMKTEIIMASFGWFGDNEHRVFNYRPRYYDPEKEELKRRFGAVDGSMEKKDGSYAPGSYIQGAFRDGNYSRKRSASKAQAIIGIVGLILLVIAMIYITKFYSLL